MVRKKSSKSSTAKTAGSKNSSKSGAQLRVADRPVRGKNRGGGASANGVNQPAGIRGRLAVSNKDSGQGWSEKNDPMIDKFFKLARQECSCHSKKGPRGIEDYCCQEPQKSEKQCRLLHGQRCEYFVEAVLPLDPDLLWLWEERLLRQGEGIVRSNLRRCQCGTHFRFKSKTHKYCEACAKKERERQARESAQKQREIKKAA
jgi:hypothetical protein